GRRERLRPGLRPTVLQPRPRAVDVRRRSATGALLRRPEGRPPESGRRPEADAQLVARPLALLAAAAAALRQAGTLRLRAAKLEPDVRRPAARRGAAGLRRRVRP